MKKVSILFIATMLSISAMAQTAYITNSGSDSVSVINIATNTVMATILVGTSPQGVSVSLDGSKVYVANYSDNTVSVINTATNTVTATIAVGSKPTGVSVSPNGSMVYVTFYGSNSLSVINTTTNTVTATILVGTSYGVSVSPDGSKVYVVQTNGIVDVINTATNTVTATISVGLYPQGVSVSPDGSKVYVTDGASNIVRVISTATNTITATILVGTYPYGICVSPDGSTVYVANNNYNSNGTVSVINSATNAIIATVTVGSGPIGISVSPDGSKVYVANKGANTVSVIDASTNTVSATIMVGTGPQAFGNFISIYPLSPPSVSISASIDTICPGAPTNLTASGATTYSWSGGLGATNPVTVAPTSTTTYTVTGTSPAGLSSASITIYVNANLTVSLASIANFININANAITLDGTPTGGIYTGAGVSGSTFNPQTAGLGNKEITYSFINGTGCIGSATQHTIVYDTTGTVCTTYDTITVTDTLIINANLTGYNPITFANTIKIYPNPTKDHIYIKSDNNSTGYQIKIINTLSQIVYQTTINQTQYYVDLNTWSGNGTYFVQFCDTNGNLLEVRKIVLQ